MELGADAAAKAAAEAAEKAGVDAGVSRRWRMPNLRGFDDGLPRLGGSDRLGSNPPTFN